MRIDEPWQDNAATEVHFFRSRCFRQTFYFRACSYRCNFAIAHQERSIFDDAEIGERGATPRSAAAQGQELRSTRDEQGIGQDAGIMPDDGRSCTER